MMINHLPSSPTPAENHRYSRYAHSVSRPQGPGVLGPLTERIRNLVPSSEFESLIYPALFEPYSPSQIAGVAAMARLVRDTTY